VQGLIVNGSHVHHLFPRKHLKDRGLSRGYCSQLAN
jgi:hypothetical protein